MRPETPYKRALISLVTSIKQYISLLDIEMRRAPSHERGRRIGALTTALDMAADHARFFTLDVDYRTGKKRKSSAAAETSPNGARRNGFTASEMEIILGQARRGLIESAADNDANGTGDFLIPMLNAGIVPKTVFHGTATHPSKAPPVPQKKKARRASRDKT